MPTAPARSALMSSAHACRKQRRAARQRPKRCGGDGAGGLGVENETSAKQTYPSYHTISSTKQWHIASQHMHESLLHKVSRL